MFAGSGNPAYPGGQFFNLCNFGSKGDMDSYKAKEIENGRLAMIAMLGAQRVEPSARSLARSAPAACFRISPRVTSRCFCVPTGYFVQAMVTGAGPYANLTAHLANPTANNILSKCVRGRDPAPRPLSRFAICCSLMLPVTDAWIRRSPLAAWPRSAAPSKRLSRWANRLAQAGAAVRGPLGPRRAAA